MEIITKTAAETKKLASEIAKTLKGGEVLALSGNLGAGKTTFVQGLAEGLGVKERVLSPSYVLMRQHKVRDLKSGVRNLIHIDLYRLSGEEEAKAIGLTELLGKKENVVVIEWAERASDIFGKSALKIGFQYGKENNRKIILDGRIKLMKLIIDSSKREETIIKIDEKEYRVSDKVLPSLFKILKDHKLTLEDFESISTFKGPGSFTGLRVGCAIANALNYGLGKMNNFQDLIFPEYGKEPNISTPKSSK